MCGRDWRQFSHPNALTPLPLPLPLPFHGTLTGHITYHIRGHRETPTFLQGSVACMMNESLKQLWNETRKILSSRCPWPATVAEMERLRQDLAHAHSKQLHLMTSHLDAFPARNSASQPGSQSNQDEHSDQTSVTGTVHWTKLPLTTHHVAGKNDHAPPPRSG